MEIKDVKLVTEREIPLDGETKLEYPYFEVEFDDGSKASILINDPSNRHYQEVALWYRKLKKKPFKFDFEHLFE